MIAKRIAWPINAYLKDHLKTIHELPFTHEELKALFTLITTKNLNDTQAKTIREEMITSWESALTIYTQKGFHTPTISDEELEIIIDQVLQANADSVKQYLEWKTGILGFLIGQVMKKTWWKLQPQHIQGMLLIRMK
jgi:aspartyl-tRNA(Asn)/glutamyl-tRNA(Gln) amidotransferase subunit B